MVFLVAGFWYYQAKEKFICMAFFKLCPTCAECAKNGKCEQKKHDIGKSPSLLGKTFDLAIAYKQVPLRPNGHSAVFICVFDGVDRRSKFFQCVVLEFGGVRTVRRFLCLARSLWRLGTFGGFVLDKFLPRLYSGISACGEQNGRGNSYSPLQTCKLDLCKLASQMGWVVWWVLCVGRSFQLGSILSLGMQNGKKQSRIDELSASFWNAEFAKNKKTKKWSRNHCCSRDTRVLFVDNEGSKFCLLKAASARMFAEADLCTRIVRMPSHSNMADITRFETALVTAKVDCLNDAEKNITKNCCCDFLGWTTAAFQSHVIKKCILSSVGSMKQ